MSKFVKILQAVSKYTIYTLVFLLPIWFLPWTSEKLDFNKQALLVLLVFVALFAWMGKVLISGKLKLNLNKTNFAVLALFLIFALSTVFSQDKYGSFWGWPRVTSESLLTIMCLGLLYFLISNLGRKEIFILLPILAASNLLAALIGVFYLLGLFIPLGFRGSTSFNTIGLVGSLGIFTSALLPLLIILVIYSKKWLKLVFGFGIVLNIALLLLINYNVVWWIVLSGCALMVLFALLKKELFDLRWLGLPMFFLVLALFFLIIKPQLPVPLRALEIYLNQPAGFDIALKTVKDLPLFGSGPGTFIFDFAKYKSADFNKNALWSAGFDGAGSKVLTILATVGILGFISFLALIAIVLFYGVKFAADKMLDRSQKDNGYFISLTSGALVSFISLAIGFFLYNSNLSLDFLFFSLAGCFIGLIGKTSLNEKNEYILTPSSFLTLAATFVFTLLFIFGLGIIIFSGQRYFAEMAYAKSFSYFNSGQTDKGIASLKKAADLNPKSDLYLRQLSQAYLLQINITANDKDLSQEDKNKYIQALITNSISNSKIATDISPNNANNWAQRGLVYQNLIGLVPGSEDWALKIYEDSQRLEPKNPYFPTQRGVTFMARATIINKDNALQRNQDLESAKKEFEKAVQLKSDYAPARFQIAMVFQLQGKTDQEIAALEEAKKYSPNDVGLLFQIGVVYYQQGNFNSARKNLENTISISPDYSNALYFLGLSYYKLGQPEKAIEKFKKISELNPENKEIKTILSNIQSGKDPLDKTTLDPAKEPLQEAPIK